MSKPRNPDATRLQAFQAGLNNVASGTKPERDDIGRAVSVRSAVNVDFDADGRARRRRGQTVADTRSFQSAAVFGEYLVAQVNGDLRWFYDDSTGLHEGGLILAGVGAFPISFTSDDYDLYWSNGQFSGRVNSALDALPLWIATPDPVTLMPQTAGGLGPGQYEVSVTVVDDEGRESGASAPAVVMVADGGGVFITFPAAPAGAAQWRVYMSGADGDHLYFVRDYPAIATSAVVGAHVPGKELATGWLYPFPRCETLRYAAGRLYGLAGNVLWWSEPYRLGLVHMNNHMVLGNEATLLEPMNSGVYVGDHKRVYWMDGTNPGEWRQIIRHPAPAVPGSSQVVSSADFGAESDTPAVVWLSASGVICMGDDGGNVHVLRDQALVLPADAERAALARFDFNGIRQLAMSVLGGSPNLRASANDYMDVEIRRNGITLP